MSHTALTPEISEHDAEMETAEADAAAVREAALQAGPSRRRAVITVGLMLSTLIAAMEGTVVSTAMPTIIGDLHGIRLYPWVFSAYLLTGTTTVPIYGKLADLFGRRPVFLIAAFIFLAGSMLSGAAHSMPQLIAFRALQGLGAGGVLPLTLTLIGDLYTLAERPRVQALFTSIWGTAGLAGPMLGAFITERLSWRWVFYVNLPFGLLAALLVGVFLREAGTRGSRSRLDYAGLLLLTGGVVALLTLLLQAGTGAGRLSLLGLFVLTVVLLAAFVRQEGHAPDPMLPLTLFRHPIIVAATIGNVLIGLMMYAVDTYMPLFMQGVRGGDATSAGQVLTPLLVCWAVSAYVGGQALLCFGFRKVALFGVSCILVSGLSLALTTARTPLPVLLAAMMVLGCGLGPSSMTFLVSAQNAVDWDQRGVVTASAQFFRTISGTVGVGALGAVLNARMAAVFAASKGMHIAPNALLNAQARAGLPPAVLQTGQRALGSGLHWIFMLMAASALVGFIGIVRIARRAESRMNLP